MDPARPAPNPEDPPPDVRDDAIQRGPMPHAITSIRPLPLTGQLALEAAPDFQRPRPSRYPRFMLFGGIAGIAVFSLAGFVLNPMLGLLGLLVGYVLGLVMGYVVCRISEVLR